MKCTVVSSVCTCVNVHIATSMHCVHEWHGQEVQLVYIESGGEGLVCYIFSYSK